MAMRKAEEGSSLQKSIRKLLGAIRIVKDIKAGTNWMIPESEAPGVDRFEPISTLFSALSPDQFALSIDLINKEINARNDSFTKSYNDQTNHVLEYRYAKVRLPLVALLLTSLAIAAFVLSKNFTYTSS